MASAALLLSVVACSGSSSAGGTATSPTPSATSSTASLVDDALNSVLAGLRTATGISAQGDLGDDGKQLVTAGGQLKVAAAKIADLHTVPIAVRTPVSDGLLRIADLLDQSGSCLVGQSRNAAPAPTPCLPALRQAEAKDAAIAHGLISLSAYGSVPPKAFERRLVAALRGG